MIPTPCIEPGCPNMAQPGPRRARCRAHQLKWETRRNARPERQAYTDPAYRSVPTGGVCELQIPGVCTYWATTRDHILPLSKGGTNDPSNIRRACRACNTSRGTGQ